MVGGGRREQIGGASGGGEDEVHRARRSAEEVAIVLAAGARRRGDVGSGAGAVDLVCEAASVRVLEVLFGGLALASAIARVLELPLHSRRKDEEEVESFLSLFLALPRSSVSADLLLVRHAIMQRD